MAFEITPEGAIVAKPKESAKIPTAGEIGQKAKEIKDKVQETAAVFLTTRKLGKKVTDVANFVTQLQGETFGGFSEKERTLVTGLLDSFVDLPSQTPQFREKVIEKVLPQGVRGKKSFSRQLSNFLASPITDLDQGAGKVKGMFKSFGFDEEQQELIFGLSNLFQQGQPSEGAEGGGWSPPDWSGIASGATPPPERPEEERREEEGREGERPEEKDVRQKIREATGKRSEYLRERHGIYWKAAVVAGVVIWLEVQFGIGPMSDVVWPALQRKEINPPIAGRFIEKIPVVGEDIVEPVPANRDLLKADIEKMKLGPGHGYTVENFLERMIRLHKDSESRDAIFDYKNWSQDQKDLFWVFEKEFEDVSVDETAESLKSKGYTGNFEEGAELIGVLRKAKKEDKTVDEIQPGVSKRFQDYFEEITGLRWSD